MNEQEQLLSDLDHAHAPTPGVIASAVSLGLAGALGAVTGLQLLAFVFISPWVALVPYLMLVAGGLLVWSGLGVYKLRALQGNVGLGLALLATPGSSAWIVLSWQAGMISLAALLWPPAALTAAVFTFKQLAYLRRATAARERLEDAGLSLGL
jgi:hypothetical protein